MEVKDTNHGFEPAIRIPSWAKGKVLTPIIRSFGLSTQQHSTFSRNGKEYIRLRCTDKDACSVDIVHEHVQFPSDVLVRTMSFKVHYAWMIQKGTGATWWVVVSAEEFAPRPAKPAPEAPLLSDVVKAMKAPQAPQARKRLPICEWPSAGVEYAQASKPRPEPEPEPEPDPATDPKAWAHHGGVPSLSAICEGVPGAREFMGVPNSDAPVIDGCDDDGVAW